MNLEDENDYLRETICQLTAPAPGWIDTLRNCGAKITRTEAKVLAYIVNAHPAIATPDKIVTAVYWDKPDVDWPDEKIIDVFVCKLRKKLKQSGSIYSLNTVWGVGYTVEIAKGLELAP